MFSLVVPPWVFMISKFVTLVPFRRMSHMNLTSLVLPLPVSPAKHNIDHINPENIHHRGMYHCTDDLLFDCFGFDQRNKTVVHLTKAKQLNPSKKHEVSRTVR